MDLIILAVAGVLFAGSIATNVYTQMLLRKCHDLILWRLEQDHEENQSEIS